MGFIPTVLFSQDQAFVFPLLSFPFFAFTLSDTQLLPNKSVYLPIPLTSRCVINRAYCKQMIKVND